MVLRNVLESRDLREVDVKDVKEPYSITNQAKSQERLSGLKHGD